MPTSGPLLETLAGAGGGLGVGVLLGWWYFRRLAPGRSVTADDGDAGDVVAVPAIELGAGVDAVPLDAAGVDVRIGELQRLHSACLDELAQRDRLVAVLRAEAAGMAGLLSERSRRDESEAPGR